MQRLAKAGLTLQATFNYQVIPEVSTEFCYKRSRLRVKNCIGVYHQWTNNKIELYAWYAWRGWCGWWVSPLNTGLCVVLTKLVSVVVLQGQKGL